ncbi:hypothetical protein ATR01nite_11870 [Acetobacter tropicalis]|uniref:Uncharacterized protein n=1 Tax=Acetobacter tropicalis TaxID=104102 RepID=A0A511FLM5_9PROT|nr:hypothetical protein ATR01nite_11870 [Acetobacter tropicalis]
MKILYILFGKSGDALSERGACLCRASIFTRAEKAALYGSVQFSSDRKNFRGKYLRQKIAS